MRYSAVFITFSILILLVCVAGVGFIFYLQNPERYYSKGVASYEAGNYVEAIENLNEYISYGYENEKASKARYFLAAAVDRKAAHVSGLQPDQADSALREKDALAMRRYIDVINQNSPKSFRIEAIVGYADICRRQERYDRFITAKLEDVIHSHPDNKIEDQIWMLLGWQYLYSGENRKAMNCFLESAGDLAKLGQAKTHLKMEQYESAFRIYEDFFNFFPSSPNIKLVRADYLREMANYAKLHQDAKKHVEAIQIWKRVADFFPESEDAENARFHIGQCYFAMENWQEALKWYLAAFNDKSKVKDEDALYQAGLSYYEMGQNVEAYKTFNTLINQYPNSIYQTRARQWVKQLKKDLEYFQE
jgi:TolA-binding protein